MKTVKWLLACYLAREYCNQALFSQRTAFLKLLRPRTNEGHLIAYPDAWLHITLDDVRWAKETSADREFVDKLLNPQQVTE